MIMTVNNDPYIDIRPYHDDEIPQALKRLINDEEFINALISHRFEAYPKWLQLSLSPIVKAYLRVKWAKLTSVEAIQLEIKAFMDKMLKKTTQGVTYSGLEKLDKNTAYLFISNHRDIAMDPALVNYGLHLSGHRTVRIAIGDNLLKKPCATELMKLNKSFIVKRSAKAPREMMKALATLSSYIKYSLDTHNSIWIAQKEGRAKDGNDFTEPAILKMLHVEGRKNRIEFGDYIRLLKIVPVSISYENDPCDSAKALELYEKAQSGTYQKSEFEDIDSIIQGIVGEKGRVHVAFGEVIVDNFETPERLAAEIDRQIHQNYRLYPINELAEQMLSNPNVETGGLTEEMKKAQQQLKEKIAALPEGAEKYLLSSYANPVKNQQIEE